jgi:uncharacterized membrane protein
VADTDPTHLEETLRTVNRLRIEHHQNATPLQRSMERITALLGRPLFIGALTVAVVGWINFNLLCVSFGHRPIDPPPFSMLWGAVSLISLYMVVLILMTQQREEQIAQHHEKLMLELIILSEQKTAKVIQLLEESRRDNPLIHDRIDRDADDMARPADPASVLDAIKDIHADRNRSAPQPDRRDNTNNL